MIVRLSAVNKHDAPKGRKLIESYYSEDKHYLLMDRAYEDNETRELAVKQGFVPVVPPKRNRKNPWEYDKELYKRHNEDERYFLRIKRFRRVLPVMINLMFCLLLNEKGTMNRLFQPPDRAAPEME